jgi:hypothetical protein
MQQGISAEKQVLSAYCDAISKAAEAENGTDEK